MINIQERILVDYSIESDCPGKTDTIRISYNPETEKLVFRFRLFSEATSGRAADYLFFHEEEGRRSWKKFCPAYNCETVYEVETKGRREYRIVLRSPSHERHLATFSIDKRVVLHDKQYEREFAELKQAYAELTREAWQLGAVEPYRRLFFTIERILRRAMGFVRYRDAHCATEREEQKLLQKILLCIGCDVFAGVYNAGFDMKTGNPIRGGVPHAPADEIGPDVTFPALCEAVKGLCAEVERKRGCKKYEIFFKNVYPVLAEYELNDDDELIKPKTWADICRDIALFKEEFEKLGYELKYYEELLLTDKTEASKFMSGGRWGYPALYKNGSLEVGGEGQADGAQV